MTQSIYQNGHAPPCPESFNLAAYVLRQAQWLPDKTALEVFDSPQHAVEQWSYAQLQQTVAATASGLKACGLRSGDRVLLRIGHSSDFPIAFLAAIWMGAIPVPSSAQLTTPEVIYLMDDLKPKAVISGEGMVLHDTAGVKLITRKMLHEMRQCDPCPPDASHKDHLAYIIYTSGTSGTPKGVAHAHRAVWARRMMWQDWMGLKSDDRMLHAGAFNWTYTLGTGLCDPWAIGATAMIYAGPPQADIWGTLVKNQSASLFAATPGVYRQLLRHCSKDDFAGLRAGLSAGETLPLSVRKQWQDVAGKPIYEALGMSEISTFISSGPVSDPKPGTSGKAQRGRRIAVLSPETKKPVPLGLPGILAISRDDPGLMLGYWHDPGSTKARMQGEWFLTGDTVTMDGAGYLSYLGRDDDMMNAGGYRVSPLEVEVVLVAHPLVEEAAAVTVQVRQDVAVIAAFVVANGPLDETELAAYVSESLARYKCPRIYKFVDALPKGANGKLRRADLRNANDKT